MISSEDKLPNTPKFVYGSMVGGAGHFKMNVVLFHDQGLSAESNLRCGSCHRAEKALTDGLVTFAGLSRNTPTLILRFTPKAVFTTIAPVV